MAAAAPRLPRRGAPAGNARARKTGFYGREQRAFRHDCNSLIRRARVAMARYDARRQRQALARAARTVAAARLLRALRAGRAARLCRRPLVGLLVTARAGRCSRPRVAPRSRYGIPVATGPPPRIRHGLPRARKQFGAAENLFARAQDFPSWVRFDAL
jgi:hypothetical protein